MKALIVIDIEDKAFEYYSKQNPKALTVGMIDHVGERGGFYSPKFISLKPMPKRKLAVFDPNHCDMEEEIKIIKEIGGYNRCINEILGEENDV